MAENQQKVEDVELPVDVHKEVTGRWPDRGVDEGAAVDVQERIADVCELDRPVRGPGASIHSAPEELPQSRH